MQIGASCGLGTKDVSTMLDPQALRERIRKNEAIIYEREVQSCFKKGKFKTDKKVGLGD